MVTTILAFAAALIIARVFDISPRAEPGIGWRILAWPFLKAWRVFNVWLEFVTADDEPEPVAPRRKFRFMVNTHEGATLVNVCTDHLEDLFAGKEGGMTLWDGFTEDHGRVSLVVLKE